MTIRASELPQYCRIAICPKCHEDDIHTAYCKKDWHYVGGWVDGEHMHRACRNCGFQWLERPLDDEPPRPTASAVAGARE